jgi:hypothetical protein
MNIKTRYPLIRLPQKVEFILFLLREDLKATRFFEGLNSIGLSDTPVRTLPGQPHPHPHGLRHPPR